MKKIDKKKCNKCNKTKNFDVWENFCIECLTIEFFKKWEEEVLKELLSRNVDNPTTIIVWNYKIKVPIKNIGSRKWWREFQILRRYYENKLIKQSSTKVDTDFKLNQPAS